MSFLSRIQNFYKIFQKTKLNSSTCVDSDSSDESIQSDSEPEEQTQTQKPTPNPKMGCIQSLVKNRGQPVNKVETIFQYDMN